MRSREDGATRGSPERAETGDCSLGFSSTELGPRGLDWRVQGALAESSRRTASAIALAHSESAPGSYPSRFVSKVRADLAMSMFSPPTPVPAATRIVNPERGRIGAHSVRNLKIV